MAQVRKLEAYAREKKGYHIPTDPNPKVSKTMNVISFLVNLGD